MRVNANISALNASRNLSVSQAGLQKSLEKLSSGFRINRAADDAAGLAISEGLRSEIRGNTQAQRNAQDGISFIQTAEGALTEVHSMLQRMRELAVQASNTATSTGVAENAEFQALATEIGNIGARTKFAGKAVFSATALTFQVGANAGETASVSTGTMLGATSVTGFDDTSGATLLATTGVLTGAGNAAAAITLITTAIGKVSTARGAMGATQNTLEHTVANLGVAVENLTASESRVRDVDMAAEMVTFTKNQILSQAGTAMLAQANQVPQGILQLLR
jgi:flagellin